MEYKKISCYVEKLLKDLAINELPVEPVDIARKRNIIVIKYCDSCIDEANFLGLKGFSFILDNDKMVYYNSNRPIRKVRFTLAHEIGHCELGHLKNGKTYYSFARGKSSVEEWEANAFAMNLLMPYFLIKEMETEKEIAKACKVNIQVVRKHLNELKGCM